MYSKLTLNFLVSHKQDQSTPLKTPLAPPPVTLNKSAQPGRPILSRSAAIVHEEHIYECIEDLLLEVCNIYQNQLMKIKNV